MVFNPRLGPVLRVAGSGGYGRRREGTLPARGTAQPCESSRVPVLPMAG